MNYKYDQLITVQLEISTHCNASCPQCPRNIHGGKRIENLPSISWSLEDLQHVLESELVQRLETVYFCGTYGDPMTNKHILDMCQWLKQVNPSLRIGIHTNGGTGAIKTYAELASLVEFIALGIDGLEDTNHLYRKHTIWKRIIDNAQAFIDAGGYAIWDFIVFKHNQHQPEEARAVSAAMGFKEFNVKKTSRFLRKDHTYQPSMDVYDTKGNVEYQLELPTNPEYINGTYEQLEHIDLNQYAKDTQVSCHMMKNNEINIGADGYVFPCGWLHDRLYGVEAEATPDHENILDMMESTGSKDNANAFKTRLRNIVDGPWFRTIQESWTAGRLERCGIICGDGINSIGNQNTDIEYK